MKQTRILMGMPITLEVIDPAADEALFDSVYGYFTYVDEKFSTYKEHSEISRINQHKLAPEEASPDMQLVFSLCDQMRLKTHGYFNIQHAGCYDPSGLVKGWAIDNAAEMIRRQGFRNFYVEAGGDIQASGKNAQGQDWRVGIRNPFNMNEIVKVLAIHDGAVATSGTYIRGQHIYNPHDQAGAPIRDVVSLTVIGPDITQADCFATAAFAMGKEGIYFIENLEGFEGYMIDQDHQATFTSGLERFIQHD